MTLAEILPHVLWQGALIGIAAAIALRLAGPTASRVRYRLALGALVLIALAPPTTVARRGGMLGEWGFASARSVDSARVSAPLVATSASVRSETGRAPSTMLPAGDPAGSSGDAWRHRLAGWLAALWGLAVASLAVRLVGGVVALHRIRATAEEAPPWIGDMARDLGPRMGVRRAVPVLLSARADTPFACGVVRPAVVLPRGLPAELPSHGIRVVLAHELAHVRRRDYLTNLGQCVLEVLVPFHPAIRWLSKVARDEREHCCDELVAGFLGDRRAVAGTLLALEEARGSFGDRALFPAAAGGPLLRRVERLLVRGPAGRPRWTVAALAVLFASGGTMVLATPAGRGPSTSIDRTATASPSPDRAGEVVWTGELDAGDWLRVRNLTGPIQVRRVAGSTGVIRASLSPAAPSDLTFEATLQDDGVTVCALSPGGGRCDAEGYTWFGAPLEMGEAGIELTVDLPSGVSVLAATFEGDLDLDGVDADAEARTGGGAIAARIVEPAGPRSDRTLDLHTGDGPVRVALPTGFGGTLEARLSNGRVVSEPPLARGGISEHGLEFSLGRGDDRLRVSSGDGDLVLSRG
jgi:beta-lactamase regulating signal transducer with metallopeptidase domain